MVRSQPFLGDDEESLGVLDLPSATYEKTSMHHDRSDVEGLQDDGGTKSDAKIIVSKKDATRIRMVTAEK